MPNPLWQNGRTATSKAAAPRSTIGFTTPMRRLPPQARRCPFAVLGLGLRDHRRPAPVPSGVDLTPLACLSQMDEVLAVQIGNPNHPSPGPAAWLRRMTTTAEHRNSRWASHSSARSLLPHTRPRPVDSEPLRIVVDSATPRTTRTSGYLAWKTATAYGQQSESEGGSDPMRSSRPRNWHEAGRNLGETLKPGKTPSDSSWNADPSASEASRPFRRSKELGGEPQSPDLE